MPTLNRKRVLALVATIVIPILSACNTWERTTFQTLAASTATVNGAHDAYQNTTDKTKPMIPQNGCSYALINDAIAADTVAVNAMVTYEQLKASKGNLQAQEAVVVSDLVALAPLVVKVESLISNPTSCVGGGN